VPRIAAGPGIRKVQRTPQVSSVLRRLTRCEPGWVQTLFARADIVSEGAFGADGATYYGTTSILLPHSLFDRVGSPNNAAAPTAVARLLAFDPHARVHALRIARTEALVRARVPLATSLTELTYDITSSELRLQIDVEARRAERGVLPKQRRSAR
jgi:hypothetical protein